MSRELLMRAGYDPDEQYELTPDIACGAALVDVLKLGGGFPLSEAEVQSVINIANDDLINSGKQPMVNLKLYGRVAKYLKTVDILS